MKKRNLVILFLCFIGILIFSNYVYNQLGQNYHLNNEKKTVKAISKEKAMDFTVYDENDHEVKLSDYKGKPIVVNFWASWCPPCKREMPNFEKMYEKYGNDITFLMINETDGNRETKDNAQMFINNQGYKMNFLYDINGSAEKTYQLLYLPRTLFIDEEGYLIKDYVGEITDQELNSKIKGLLNNGVQKEKMSITYLFGNKTEVLSNSKLQSWVKVKGKKRIINEEKIQEYVSKLSLKYDTYGKSRIFHTTDGKEITINQGKYGYQIDQEKEKQQIIADIKNKVSIQKEPIYKFQGIERNGEDDSNGNYIEISLQKQHLWFYKKGTLVTETDIVSGLPTNDRETCTGIWQIPYKASPYTLKSEEYDYQIKVTYWMSFVCGQGLHDASWRTNFGGEIYKVDGSHGYINLPQEQAKTIYENVEQGYPVIIY